MNGPLGDYCTQGRCAHGRAALPWRRYQQFKMEKSRRHCRNRRPDRRFFRQRGWLAWQISLRSLGFALADSTYADRVIVVTIISCRFRAYLGRFRATTSILCAGRFNRRSGGDCFRTTQITRSPDRLRIAEMVAQLLRDTGIMKNGFSFQAERRNCAGIRRISETDDEAGWREGALRPRRIHEIPGRAAATRAHGLHPRWPDVRSRWREVDGQ